MKKITTLLNEIASSMFAVEDKTASISLPASDTKTVTINMEKTGYTFLGVIGLRCEGTGATLGFPTAFCKNNATTAAVTLRNTTSTARNFTVRVYGLYTKLGG